MNCRRARRLLSGSHDGLPIGREANTLAAHLQGCHACCQFRDALMAFRGRLRELEEWQPGPSHDLRVRAIDRWNAAREAPSLDRRRGFLPSISIPPIRQALLGAVTLAVFGAALMLSGRQEGRRNVIPRTQIVRSVLPDPTVSPSPLVRRLALKSSSRRIARNDLPPDGTSSRKVPHSSPAGLPGNKNQASGSRSRSATVGQLPRVNRDPAVIPKWMPLRQEEWDEIEARVHRSVRVRDARGPAPGAVRSAAEARLPRVQIPFPQLASTSDGQIAAVVESYKREAAIVDARLSRAVTLQQKATALSDVCERLRADTGIALAAGPSVADEKVSIFCARVPLRDAMRQLSRPFGYVWLRSGKTGEYRYELVQDLRSQLLEEELRNRDRDEALLALDREIERYRRYLDLSPDEALARSKTASPAEKPLLEKLAGRGWGPIRMYFRLSRSDQHALRSGKELQFSADPLPGQQPLPPDVARGVLQSFRDKRLARLKEGFTTLVPTELAAPEAVPLTAASEVGALVTLRMQQSELGQFTIDGHSGVFSKGFYMTFRGGPYAVGQNHTALEPDNSRGNARLAQDPTLSPRVTVAPARGDGAELPIDSAGLPHGAAPRRSSTAAAKVTTADVLEALHRATGTNLVADYYTRLYQPDAVTVRHLPVFAALNQLSDTMHLRWHKEGSWLQFRSTTFYDDRTKEVPNRLLARWIASRRQHGALTLDDLLEIARLADAQLDGEAMAEGARDYFGLAEWDLARNSHLRPHLRYLTKFTPEQRQEAASGTGLAFAKMSLAQQQQFIAFAFPPDEEPIQAAVRDAGFDSSRLLEELKQGVLRVEYTQPGWFQWGNPALSGQWFRWVVAVEPGPRGRRVLRPPVRERTREAALQAVRRLDPQLREAAVHQLSLPGQAGRAERPIPLEEQIFPSELGLTIVYIPGPSNALLMRILNHGGPSWQPSG